MTKQAQIIKIQNYCSFWSLDFVLGLAFGFRILGLLLKTLNKH
mgnify:CR=1